MTQQSWPPVDWQFVYFPDFLIKPSSEGLTCYWNICHRTKEWSRNCSVDIFIGFFLWWQVFLLLGNILCVFLYHYTYWCRPLFIIRSELQALTFLKYWLAAEERGHSKYKYDREELQWITVQTVELDYRKQKTTVWMKSSTLTLWPGQKSMSSDLCFSTSPEIKS